MKNMLQKKKRVPISSQKTLLSNKTRFFKMKRATRLSHKAVHDKKTRFMSSFYPALKEESRENFDNTGYIRS